MSYDGFHAICVRKLCFFSGVLDLQSVLFITGITECNSGPDNFRLIKRVGLLTVDLISRDYCSSLLIYARKLAKHNERLVGRQMINVLAQPTNNAGQFRGQRTEANLSANTSQNFAPVCLRFLACTGSRSHLLLFVCHQS